MTAYGRIVAVVTTSRRRAKDAAWLAAQERLARLVSLAILGGMVGIALAAPLALAH